MAKEERDCGKKDMGLPNTVWKRKEPTMLSPKAGSHGMLFMPWARSGSAPMKAYPGQPKQELGTLNQF